MSGDRIDLQRFRDGSDPDAQAQVWLEASRVLGRQGDLDESRRLLRAAVRTEPDCTDAWLRLAWLAEDRQERKALLRRVLALQPEHVQARAELVRLQRPSRPSAMPVEPKKSRVQRWALGLLGIAAGLLLVTLLVWGPVKVSAGRSTERLRGELADLGGLAWLGPTPTAAATPTPTPAPSQIATQFVPQLQTAVSNSDWDRALEIVDIMEGVDPSGEEVQQWALATHLQCGQALVEAGQVEEAQVQFDRAVVLAPGQAEPRLWSETTRTYLAGEQALEAGDWDAAIESFSLVQEQMPGYGEGLARLVETYRRQGEAAMRRQDWTVAIEALLQAYERMPDDWDVVRLLSLAYCGQGRAAIADEKWTVAIETLAQAHEQLPADADAADLLSTAYRQRGMVLYEKGKLKQARADLEAALELRPDDAQAQAYLDKVMHELFPPKLIEINISKQRFYAWEDDKLVYSFATSTGLRGRDTATGHFRVLDKIPMAYSSIWRLKMPYWLGIYYVGRIENGIHALPIRPDGSVMWGGLLGQRASYGCVILSTEAARLIYNWADIGTPVHIHY